MLITAGTDLTQFAGRRVTIDTGRLDGTRAARIDSITHGVKYETTPTLHGGFCGMCVEDPHGDCRGGATAFWWPYGTDLTIEEMK